MKSISSSQRLILFVLMTLPAVLPSTAQTLSAKEVKAALTSSAWKLEAIWNQKDQEENESIRTWEVTTVEDSRNYKDHFGIIAFQFFPNGTFKGTHYKGKQVEGKWSYSGGKKKSGLNLNFEANVENDDPGGSYQYHINFQKLEFTSNDFVAEGDICHDGCYQKVKFTKGKYLCQMAVQRKLNYEERLVYVTRNLVVYNEYGKDPLKASKIIKKYFPAKSLEVCQKSMADFVKAYQEGIDFVEIHKEAYWKAERPIALKEAEKVFFEAHSGISSGILFGMLYDIFNWYHER